MREGWVADDYLILFDAGEFETATARYAFPEMLPGYRLLGLRSWDEFIVDDNAGHIFTVPTVPAAVTHLAPFQLSDFNQPLNPDERFVGKIKWYLKPIVFGGDPSSNQNLVWITHDQHAQLVRYWNGMYRSMKTNPA